MINRRDVARTLGVLTCSLLVAAAAEDLCAQIATGSFAVDDDIRYGLVGFYSGDIRMQGDTVVFFIEVGGIRNRLPEDRPTQYLETLSVGLRTKYDDGRWLIQYSGPGVSIDRRLESGDEVDVSGIDLVLVVPELKDHLDLWPVIIQRSPRDDGRVGFTYGHFKASLKDLLGLQTAEVASGN